MEKILTEMILGGLTLMAMMLISTYAAEVFLVLILCLVSWGMGYIITYAYESYKSNN